MCDISVVGLVGRFARWNNGASVGKVVGGHMEGFRPCLLLLLGDGGVRSVFADRVVIAPLSDSGLRAAEEPRHENL